MRLTGATKWKKYTLYRRVPANGVVNVTMALTGLGTVYFDDVRIEPLTASEGAAAAKDRAGAAGVVSVDQAYNPATHSPYPLYGCVGRTSPVPSIRSVAWLQRGCGLAGLTLAVKSYSSGPRVFQNVAGRSAVSSMR